jgi:hypothetical protein
MSRQAEHTTIGGERIGLSDLTDDEQFLVRILKRKADNCQDQNEFDNYWMKSVSELYLAAGLAHRQIQQTKPYRIARDLSERVSIRLGVARPPDYRDQLAELIRTQFVSRKAFCDATGLSEGMLSHVLARRKHLSIDSLEKALDRIGYTLHLLPKTKQGR